MDNKEKEEKTIETAETSTVKEQEIPEKKEVEEKKEEPVLPETKEEKKEEETPKEEEKKEEPAEESKEEEKPAIVIPEEKEDVKIQGKEMEAADFSSMFNVASEEKPEEEKKEEPKEEQKQEATETPAIVIPEEKEDVKIQGKEMEQADFSSMFNVASEETPEVKPELPKETEAPAEATPVATPEVPAEQAIPAEREIKKTSKFNSEERTLYTIKEEKESNPIGVILFFIILGAVIVFLPQLTKTSEAALDKLYANRNKAPVQEEEKKEEIKSYYFEQTLEFDLDNLNITNAIKSKTGDEYFLTMTIFNRESKPYTFDKNYYIILYNENQIVSRAKFFSYDAIAPNGASELSFPITQGAKESANRFVFMLVDKNDYPEVTLNNVEDGYNVLTCSYLNDELKYYFKDDKLVKIKEKYSEQKNIYTTEYDKHLEEFKELSKKYDAIDSFESVFIEREYEPKEYTEKDREEGLPPPVLAEFEVVNNLDLLNINDKSLSNLKKYKYFSYNESKNVVSYEITGFGYTCGN